MSRYYRNMRACKKALKEPKLDNKENILLKKINDDSENKIEFDDKRSASDVPIKPFIPPPASATLQEKKTNKTMLRDTYLNLRKEVFNHPSQKDWFVGKFNVSSDFRKFQISNVNILEDGGIFQFSSDVENILSLHHIMLIDLTKMKKPNYVTTDERSWRSAIRQISQPDPPDFFGKILNEYEKTINDIDQLRLLFYKMWGTYYEKVIYSDDERRIFETLQIVSRSFFERMHMPTDSVRDDNEDTVMHEYIHDAFKETFRDENYVIVWANSISESSKDHRATYGCSQGKKTDMTIYRIIEEGGREEICFIEAKPFSISRKSKIGGYNLYKVGIFCQGGLNNMISLHGTKFESKTFGGHICEAYIYFFSMDLEYDGIYRFIQLSEIKIAQGLHEFNLVRKLIMETYFLKSRIDNYYSDRYGRSESPHRNDFVRQPAASPRASGSNIPDVDLN